MSTPLPRDPIAAAHRQWISHGWGEQADTVAAVTSLMRSASIFLQRADAILKAHSLTFARFEVLALLGFSKNGSLPMSQASALLQVHATSLTNSVDRLEAQDLVHRISHPTDGRTRLLELTEKGRQVLSHAQRDLNAKLFTDSGMPEADIKNLIQILARFRHSNGDFL